MIDRAVSLGGVPVQADPATIVEPAAYAAPHVPHVPLVPRYGAPGGDMIEVTSIRDDVRVYIPSGVI